MTRAHHIADAGFAVFIASSVAHAIPLGLMVVANAFGILWYGVQLYESETIQRLILNRKDDE